MKNLLLPLFFSLLVSSAHAATLIVDSPDDSLDAITGTCTLRGAVDAINNSGDAHNCFRSGDAYGTNDTIKFDSGLSGATIPVVVAGDTSNPGGGIEIKKSLIITGLLDNNGKPAITLDADGKNRIFYFPRQSIAAANSLDITGVKFTNGQVKSGGGGAIMVDSFNHTLTLKQCVFQDNHASIGGGAVSVNSSSSSSMISDSTFSDNSTTTGHGGAVASGRKAIIRNSTFNKNSAHTGGAVHTLTFADISNSTFIGNWATEHGGAVYTSDLIANHLTLLGNSTNSINRYDSYGGQALYIFSPQRSSLSNSIIIGSNNKAQCVGGYSVVKNSYNLEGWVDAAGTWQTVGTTCATTAPVTVTGTPPLNTIIAAALADNGGPTPTLALPSGSPATNAAGGTSQMLDSTGAWVEATLDQRGYERASTPGARSIGAYEESHLSITTDTLNEGRVGDGSYSQAIDGSGATGTPGWSASGLPGDLVIGPSGIISGKPAAGTQGDWEVIVTYSDPTTGRQTFRVYNLTIQAAPLAIIGNMPATGTVGVAYTGNVSATGGVPAYTYKVTEGDWPPGLVLNPDTGEVTGEPELAGTYSFTITVADADSPPKNDSVGIIVTIAAPPVPPSSGATPIPALPVPLLLGLMALMGAAVTARQRRR